jgi:HlyD family secretion protein
MNQSLLPIIIGAAITFMVIGAIAWRFASRIAKPGGKRTLLRVGSLALAAVLIGFGGLAAANSQITGEVATETVVVPAEIMTVGTGTLAQTLSAAGSLLPADEIVLNFTASAPVSEVLVQVGDVVQAGDVLARLDTTDAQARVRDAEIALAEAQAARDELVAPASDLDIRIAEADVAAAQASMSGAVSQAPTEAEIEIARLEVEQAKNQLWQTQINRDVRLAPNPEFRGDNAYAQELSTNAGVANAETSVQLAQAEYEATVSEGPDASSLASANAQYENAQAQLNELLNGPSESELRKADIDVESAQLELDEARRELEQTVLVAPFDGLVAEENLTVGELPSGGEDNTAAITLIDLSTYIVDLSVDETDIINLALGQTVNLDIQALGDTPVTGRITRLDIAPTISGQLVTYTTQVTLDPVEFPLRPGMSATAEISLQQLEDVITVPNRFIQTDATTGQATVTVEIAPGSYAPVPVTLGLRGDEESQIVSGIDVGQTIVILPTEGDTTTQTGFGFPGIPGAGGPPAGGGGFGGGGNR